MIMITDYAAKLLHEERSARWQQEAASYRLARALRSRQERSAAITNTTGQPAQAAPVPRPRRQREPATVADTSELDDIAHAVQHGRRAA